MKNKLKLLLVLGMLHYTLTVSSQIYISSQVSGNYWRHSELYGLGVGMGVSYQKQNYTFSINYEYGYGACNRVNKFDNINYNVYTTVFLDVDEGNWREYLGIEEGYSNKFSSTSDYAKQHQLSLMGGYNVFSKNNLGLTLSAGVYGAIVEHFFTFKNIPIHYIDLTPFYQGPLNYIPVHTQKILTYGLNFEASLNIYNDKKTWIPFVIIGLGPNYSSYYGLGLRLRTKAMFKQRN